MVPVIVHTDAPMWKQHVTVVASPGGAGFNYFICSYVV